MATTKDRTRQDKPMPSDEESAHAASPMLMRLEIYFAAALSLIAACLFAFMPYLIASGGISSAQDFITLSPIFFPRLAFAVLTGLCLCYLLNAWHRAPARQRAADPADPAEKARFLRGARMAIIIAAYAVFVSRFGYGLSTLLMAGAAILYLGVRQAHIIAPVAILMPIVIRFVFERLLLISLPRSEFESIAIVEDAIMRFLSSVFLGT